MIKTLTKPISFFSTQSKILTDLKSSPNYTRDNPTIVVDYLTDLI